PHPSPVNAQAYRPAGGGGRRERARSARFAAFLTADGLRPRFGAEVVLIAGGPAAADAADQHAVARDGIAAGADDHAVALGGVQPEAGILPRGLDEFPARAAKRGREGGLALGGLEGEIGAAVGPQ